MLAGKLHELVVGSERGLEAWGIDGEPPRMISPGPALHPRWLDPGAVLVIVPSEREELTERAAIQRIALATGERQTLATLPSFACGPPAVPLVTGDFPLTLGIQDERDFQLEPTHHYLCMRLMDRNANMANLGVDVRLDLQTRAVQRWVWVGEDVCTPPHEVVIGQAPSTCDSSAWPERPSVEPPPARFDMTNADGQVLERTPAGKLRGAFRLGDDYSPGAASPSGRWRVLGGDELEGDYLYRNLVLLDREHGQVFPLVSPAGGWPAPLQIRGSKQRRIATPVAGTLQVVAETQPTWLRLSGGVELLLVGSLVVQPGVRTFSVNGQVAQ